MPVVQRGISLERIRAFLGHGAVKTTQSYARTTLERPRKALENIRDPALGPTLPSWQENKPLRAWLQAL